MTHFWPSCKNILCIRPDNMGDVIMSGPAIRALKESFDAHITLLTSSMAKDIVQHMPDIDEAIIFDLPWVKTGEQPGHDQLMEVVSLLKQKEFDAAVIFTVYSQNPLPSALLAYMAGIPNVLAYCRENPYNLISHWVPDKEPYELIKHQVRRDLDLVKTIGATTSNENLSLKLHYGVWETILEKLQDMGLKPSKPWVILHAGVSEKKREYPVENWVEVARRLIDDMGYQVLFTGSAGEKELTDQLQKAVGANSYSAAGQFNLEQFICLIKNAPFMISVNTGTVHIAAAAGTPVVVLYAQTNPQHTPWQVPHQMLEFSVTETQQSKNEVIAHVNKSLYIEVITPPSADEVMNAIHELTIQSDSLFLPPHEIPGQNQEIAAS